MDSKSKGEIVLYQTPEGDTQIDVKLDEETVWLTPPQIAILFNKARPTILEHIKNGYSEGELDQKSTRRKFRHVQKEKKRIADNALDALCLLIAESNPKEKQIIAKLVVNLINRSN